MNQIARFTDSMRVKGMHNAIATLIDEQVQGCANNKIEDSSFDVDDFTRIANMAYLTASGAMEGANKPFTASVFRWDKSVANAPEAWAFFEYMQALLNGNVSMITVYAPVSYLLGENKYSSNGEDSYADDMIIFYRYGEEVYMTWARKDADRLVSPVAVDATTITRNALQVLRQCVTRNESVSGVTVKNVISAVLKSAAARDYIDENLADIVRDSVEVEVSAFSIERDRVMVYGGLTDINAFKCELAVDNGASKRNNTTQATNKAPTKATTAEATTTKGNNIMNLSKIIAANKDAAVNAGKMEAGRLVVDRIIAVLKKQKAIPFVLRGYIDSDIGRVIVANVFKTAVDAYAPDNRIAKLASEKAVDSAVLQLIQGFDIPALVASVMDGITMSPETEIEQSNQVPINL